MRDKKIIGLVLGNGFDLDLGYKTSYKNYAKSDFCPFTDEKFANKSGDSYSENELFCYLHKQNKIDKWFDLEKHLAQFVFNMKGPDSDFRNKKVFPVNLKQFKSLKSSLTDYIASEINKHNPESKSVASHLILKYLSYYTDYESGYNNYVIEQFPIFSFNYSNLKEIVNDLKCSCGKPSSDFKYYHIHGSTGNNDVILGCGDGAFEKEGYFNPKYNFLRKSFDLHYDPPVLPIHLINCDEIIFFGLSFGDIDYQYFDCIINELCKFDKKCNIKDIKKLTFFVKDEESRLSLLKLLNERTHKHLNQLFTLNQVKLFVTDGSDCERIDYYLDTNFPSPLLF